MYSSALEYYFEQRKGEKGKNIFNENHQTIFNFSESRSGVIWMYIRRFEPAKDSTRIYILGEKMSRFGVHYCHSGKTYSQCSET